MVTPPRAGTPAIPQLGSASAVKLYLSEHFARETDPMRLLQVTQETIGRYVGASRVVYGEIDADQTTMTVQRDWTDGVPSRTGLRPFDRESTFARLYAEGRTLAFADTLAEPSLVTEHAYLERERVRAFFGVPVIEDGRFVAVFNATVDAPRAWREEEVLIVAQTGARLWGALQHLRTLARLRESEEQFRMLAENIPALCWLTDAAGLPIWGNGAWQAFFAGSRGARGDPSDVLHADELARVTVAWAEAIAAGAPIEMTLRLRGPDGLYYPFLSRAVPIRAAYGSVARWCGTMIDLIEQEARTRREAFPVAWSDVIRSETEPGSILRLTLDLLGRELDVSSAAYSEAGGGSVAWSRRGIAPRDAPTMPAAGRRAGSKASGHLERVSAPCGSSTFEPSRRSRTVTNGRRPALSRSSRCRWSARASSSPR